MASAAQPCPLELTPASIAPRAQELQRWGIYLGTVLVGVAVSPGFASGMALLGARVPLTGMLQGAISTFSGAGCTLQPLLVSVLAKRTPLGFQGLMWMALVSFVAMIALLLVEGYCAPEPRLWAAEDEVLAVEGQGLSEPLLGGAQQGE